jgi:hypothetical protein
MDFKSSISNQKNSKEQLKTSSNEIINIKKPWFSYRSKLEKWNSHNLKETSKETKVKISTRIKVIRIRIYHSKMI